MTSEPINHRRIWKLAWPMIIANAATPLLGIVDTAVIGSLGKPAALGAIAVGTLIFNSLYWGFGFLRMGTTGLSAQALGRADEHELRLTLMRAVLLGAALGMAAIALRHPIAAMALGLIAGSSEVENLTEVYFAIRIWSAPATLMVYALVGWLIGIQKTRYALAIQIWLNAVNIISDIVFVVGFGWGVQGVAMGTVLAEVTALVFASGIVLYLWRQRYGKTVSLDYRQIFEFGAVKRMLGVNRDIFLRTMFLLVGFAWFTGQGAKFGDITLAANYVLLQFLNFSAFFLDGFAYAAESLVGHAFGTGQRNRVQRTVRLSMHLAATTALLLSIILLAFGPHFIDALTASETVRAEGRRFLLWAAAYPLIAVWCFQFDGIFIGATRTVDMRNMMALAFAAYLVAWYVLTSLFGNHGLWAAFTIFAAVRGLALWSRYPALLRSVPT